MASKKSTTQSKKTRATPTKEVALSAAPTPPKALDMESALSEVMSATGGVGTSADSDASVQRPEHKTKEEKLRMVRMLKQKHPDKFISADELASPYILRRPTGIIALDIQLGGGFPAGGPSALSGTYNSGKSYLLYSMFAMQQRIYGDDFLGAIANSESAPDYFFMRKCGFYVALPESLLEDMNRSRHKSGLPDMSSAELDYWRFQRGHVELIQGDTGEEILDGIEKLNEANCFSLIALDSINALMPTADADKELTEANMRGAHAQMCKKFWLHYTPTVRKGTNLTTFMFTQQVVQADLSRVAPFMQKFMPTTETKGAEATKHYKLIDVIVEGSTAPALIKNADKVVEAKEITFSVKKGKAGTHDNIKGKYVFNYDSAAGTLGADIYGDLFVEAARRGAVINSNGTLYAINTATGSPLDEITYKNDRELIERLRADPPFEMSLRYSILYAAGIRECLYR